MKRKKEPPDDPTEEEDRANCSTVRCSLTKALKQPALWKPRIEDAVRRTSRMSYLTTLLIDAHLTQLCSENKPVPAIDRHFVYHATAVVCDYPLLRRFPRHMSRVTIRDGKVLERSKPAVTQDGCSVDVSEGRLKLDSRGNVRVKKTAARKKAKTESVWTPVEKWSAEELVLQDGSRFPNFTESPVEVQWKGDPAPDGTWKVRRVTNETVELETGKVFKNPRRHDEIVGLKRTFDQWMRPHVGDVSKLGKGLGHEREELSKDLETRFQMFNQDALGMHQVSYFRAVYGPGPDGKGAMTKKHAAWFAAQVRRFDDFSVPDKYADEWPQKYPQHFGSAEDITASVLRHREEYDRICQVREKGWRTPEGKVRYRYEMLRRIEELDPECRRCRRFTLFPQHRLGRKFITLTNSIVQEIDNACASRGQRQAVCLQDVFDMQLLASNKWVQAEAKRNGQTTGKGAGGVVRTDGIQFQMVREAAEKPMVAQETSCKMDPRLDPRFTDPKQWVGLDPGHTNMFTTVHWVGDRYVSHSVSKRHWDSKTRRKYANKVSTKRKTPG